MPVTAEDRAKICVYRAEKAIAAAQVYVRVTAEVGRIFSLPGLNLSPTQVTYLVGLVDAQAEAIVTAGADIPHGDEGAGTFTPTQEELDWLAGESGA